MYMFSFCVELSKFSTLKIKIQMCFIKLQTIRIDRQWFYHIIFTWSCVQSYNTSKIAFARSWLMAIITSPQCIAICCFNTLNHKGWSNEWAGLHGDRTCCFSSIVGIQRSADNHHLYLTW